MVIVVFYCTDNEYLQTFNLIRSEAVSMMIKASPRLIPQATKNYHVDGTILLFREELEREILNRINIETNNHSFHIQLHAEFKKENKHSSLRITY